MCSNLNSNPQTALPWLTACPCTGLNVNAQYTNRPVLVGHARSLCSEAFPEWNKLLPSGGVREEERASIRDMLALKVHAVEARTASVRVQLRAAGAAVVVASARLPPKLNPVVQSLMTAVLQADGDEEQQVSGQRLARLVAVCLACGRKKVASKIAMNLCKFVAAGVVSQQTKGDDDDASRTRAAAGALACVVSSRGDSVWSDLPALLPCLQLPIAAVVGASEADLSAAVLEGACAAALVAAIAQRLHEGAIGEVLGLAPSLLSSLVRIPTGRSPSLWRRLWSADAHLSAGLCCADTESPLLAHYTAALKAVAARRPHVVMADVVRLVLPVLRDPTATGLAACVSVVQYV